MGSRSRNAFVLAFVLALLVASAIVIATKPTVLGLDLKGGTQLVYQAHPEGSATQVTPDDMSRAVTIMRERTNKLGVSESEVAQQGSDQISVGLPNVSNAKEAIKLIGATSQLYFYDFEANVIPPPSSNAPRSPTTTPDPNPNVYTFPRLYDAVKFASRQKPTCWGGRCTASGPTYYLFDRRSLQLIAGPTEARKDLFVLLPHGKRPPGSRILAVPQGTVVVSNPDNPSLSQSPQQISSAPAFVMRDRPALSGNEITDPKQEFDPVTNQPIVTFGFTGSGREAFQRITRQIALRGQATAPPATTSSTVADNYSQHFGVVLDGQMVTLPIINFVDNPDGIDGRQGAQIQGNFTIDSAQQLAEFLQIGALPVNLTLISQSTVSATLGAQALHEGLVAGAVGLALIVLFLIAYYRLLGLVAVLGLAIYGVIFYALVKLKITLTLPGIAGLILTIGVAADANIVIFERIKEEARAGRSMLSAIAEGYRKGIATIVDANVITLITAFILFVLATASVKGFAFTLGIGTIVSLLTAVLFTHAFLGLFGRGRWLRSPRALGAGPQRVRWSFDFSGASRWFFTLSGVILTVGAVALATKQLNLGIDFTGGTKVEAALAKPATVEQVRSALAAGGVPNTGQAEIQTVNDPNFGDHVIQIEGKFGLEPRDAQRTFERILSAKFGLQGSDAISSTNIGSTFGAQIERSALISIIFSLLVISAYVAIRFEAKYAVPVIIALLHDILITGGVYALTGREVTSGTVAAFLTILGYSMYDTIIVFDRIRENVPRMPRAAFSQVANRSMSEVLTRSLITGLSTVFLVGVLYAFGGDTLKDFAFAMMVGVFSGGYSSIFIATPVLTHWKEREPAYRSRRAQLEELMGYVPTFPEENVVVKTEPRRAREPVAVAAGAPAGPAAPAEPPPAPAPAPEAPLAGDGADGAGAPTRPEGVSAAARPEGDRPARAGRQQRRKQQRRRRKHGRNR